MSYGTAETDFTKEDHGRYKPPVLDGDLTYAELETRVLAALGKPQAKIASRTLTQIKLHAGLPAGFDLSPVIEGMSIDRKIRSESNGTITAFFRFEDKPEKFHLTGDRQVEAEFVENYRPDPIRTDEEFAAMERIERRSETMPDEPGKKKGRQARALDTAQLEELATTCSTQVEVADKLAISKSYLALKLKDPANRAAYDRGRAKWFEANPVTQGTRQPRPAPTHPVTLHKRVNRDQPDLDAAEVERLAATGATAKQAAEALGVTVFVFKNRIAKGKGTNNAIRDAWYRGVEQAKAGGVKPNRGPRPVKGDPPPKSGDADVREPVREPLEISTPEPVIAEVTALTDEFDNLNRADGYIPTPADICANCLNDLPEDTALWFPHFPEGETDECWQFCSAECRNATLADREDNDPASDNEAARDGESLDEYSTRVCPPFEGEIIGFKRKPASEVFDGKTEWLERFGGNGHNNTETETNPNPAVIIHDARQRVQSRYITFQDGSQLLVGFEGNFFEMTPDDRKLLDAIAGMIQSYPDGVHVENKASQIAEFAQDKRSLWQRIRAVFT